MFLCLVIQCWSIENLNGALLIILLSYLEIWDAQDVDKIPHKTGAYNSHNATHNATALQQTDILTPIEKSKDHLW